MSDGSASTCPLCGRPNQCALASGQLAATACWCAQVIIAPAVLDRLPPDQRGRACLCPTCATGAGRPGPAASPPPVGQGAAGSVGESPARGGLS